MTKEFLSQQGVPFTEVNAVTSVRAVGTVATNLTVPPLVVIGHQSVSGYNRRRLRRLVERWKAR